MQLRCDIGFAFLNHAKRVEPPENGADLGESGLAETWSIPDIDGEAARRRAGLRARPPVRNRGRVNFAAATARAMFTLPPGTGGYGSRWWAWSSYQNECAFSVPRQQQTRIHDG